MTSTTTHRPRVVSRDEWLEARRDLLVREKALTRRRDKLLEQRRTLPMVRIDADYTFTGPDGEASLLDLFDGCGQLVVHHYMWPDIDVAEGCPSCSMFVDTIGDLTHLAEGADTAFAFVARAPIEVIEPFRARMGWDRPLWSCAGTTFHTDFGARLDPAAGLTDYNFRDETDGIAAGYTGDLPGESVFLRDGDDVFHTYSTYARGTEELSTPLMILDLTPHGRREAPGEVQPWVRFRDRYGQAG